MPKKPVKKEEVQKPPQSPLAVKDSSRMVDKKPEYTLKDLVQDEEMRIKAGLQRAEEFEYPEYLNHYQNPKKDFENRKVARDNIKFLTPVLSKSFYKDF